jgi:hypothetical protein
VVEEAWKVRRWAEVLGATEYGRNTYVVAKNSRPVTQIVPFAEETIPSTKRKQRSTELESNAAVL